MNFHDDIKINKKKNELLNLVKPKIRIILGNASLFNMSIIESKVSKIIRETVLHIGLLSLILYIISSL